MSKGRKKHSDNSPAARKARAAADKLRRVLKGFSDVHVYGSKLVVGRPNGNPSPEEVQAMLEEVRRQ